MVGLLFRTNSASLIILDRLVMQDHKDPRAFTIVERYAHESSQKCVQSRARRSLKT